jgi:glyoxylase-like metal-dependent hydrolase (beta-lactamase superfamily II)
MKLKSIETGNFKLDGGAIFGVVPKSLWNKVYPADENNMINLSMRSLLIDDGKNKILIDNGLGTKLDPKFASYYFLNGDDSLEKSLKNAGYQFEDITDVIITHLHFDHCGGSVLNKNGRLLPAFPNAVYHISRAQWKTANNPNQREKASFLKENFLPLYDSGQINFIDDNIEILPNIEIRLFNGHTEGLIVPFIKYNDKTIVYITDLIPTVANLPLSWITAYDIYPLVAMHEKELLLKEAVERNYILFFEHDIYNEACTLTNTPKGIRMEKVFHLNEIL